MKFCMSTDVGTWTNWSTFEPDQDHSPDARTRKSKIDSQSNRHLTQSRLQVTRYTVEKYCLLHFVVQGPGSFRGQLNFLVLELRGVKLAQFSAYFPIHHIYVLVRPDAAAMRGFIQSAVETTMSEVNALHHSSYISSSRCVCTIPVGDVLFELWSL